MRGLMTVLALCLLLLRCQAANVEWNFLRSSYLEYVGDGNIYLITGSSSQTSFFTTILVSCTSDGWRPTQGYSTVISTIALRQMSIGDVVSAETMVAEGLDYFYKATWGEPTRSDYPIPLEYGDIFLGMAAETYDENREASLIYGWLKFDPTSYDPVPCAWDLDGGPMIVGGGAIPEPSSAVLLLVGLAGLGLKRKRIIA